MGCGFDSYWENSEMFPSSLLNIFHKQQIVLQNYNYPRRKAFADVERLLQANFYGIR